jgi:hypothetical protein
VNVPEAFKATERAVITFERTVAEAREQLASDLQRIHSELLEEQPLDVAVKEDFARKHP